MYEECYFNVSILSIWYKLEEYLKNMCGGRAGAEGEFAFSLGGYLVHARYDRYLCEVFVCDRRFRIISTKQAEVHFVENEGRWSSEAIVDIVNILIDSGLFTMFLVNSERAGIDFCSLVCKQDAQVLFSKIKAVNPKWFADSLEDEDERVLRKVLFTGGMSSDCMLIVTDASNEDIEGWCYRYNEAVENGTYGTEVTLFDSLKEKGYYVSKLLDSDFEVFDRDVLDAIGYDEQYDLFHYYVDNEEDWSKSSDEKSLDATVGVFPGSDISFSVSAEEQAALQKAYDILEPLRRMWYLKDEDATDTEGYWRLDGSVKILEQLFKCNNINQ